MKIISVWADHVSQAEFYWLYEYKPKGYSIVQPIEIKFNWKKFRTMYNFKVKKYEKNS